MRIGQGYDVHAFTAGSYVTLGGERIPHVRGVQAHSDGDVLLHALCDALLGAAGLGDIGIHFPDSEARWRGADSRGFLRHVRELLQQKGYRIVNVDATILAEAPRLGAHRAAMRANIAADLCLETARVNIKATTGEGLGFIGHGEGLACQAIALIEYAPEGTGPREGAGPETGSEAVPV
ncbi:2-C-methyl-D-erythritol 2,4-cyclodiphosphate synthase [Steroidobacter denitrificans]|uniref:2-C-methyl-D-erythritol 2,4-cyclodiphosphate synthase n=1 Tax=Steroidobacter denitrificans TaxID=465721 RepID=A0A127FCI9_STEDE|nr:2-C-methyl-D-erythritol 2,4-cyclodiphosphate synthase [Steroidobacter denitrificans]